MKTQPNDSCLYNPNMEHFSIDTDDSELHAASVVIKVLNRHLDDNPEAQRRIISWVYDRVHNIP